VGTQLADLLAAGQSIWLDNIRRNMFASGELKKLVAGGLRGMTSKSYSAKPIPTRSSKRSRSTISATPAMSSAWSTIPAAAPTAS
jgi:hypothetical protein